MTEQEALQILGLQPGASADAVNGAYYAQVARERPDAARTQVLTEARDSLLRQAHPQAGGAAGAPHASVPSIGAGHATVAPPAAAETSAAAGLAASTVRFLGLDQTYWWLLVRGSALLAVTLGIYRFWLTTDMRRFLWSNTEIAGETLEYTGTARELLLGFLIAMAILIPIYAILFMAALNVGRLAEIAAPLSFLILTVLGQYAVFRARRYRLTRTIYRGVRFHQTGSAWRYAACAMFWWVVIALTLGLAYPLAQASLERYKLKNTYLGNLVGRFEGSAGRLFLRGFLMWLVVIGPLLAGLGAMAATATTIDLAIIDDMMQGGAAAEDARKQFAAEHPAFVGAAIGSLGALFWSFTAALLLYPVFQAMLLRWWVSGLRFGEVSLTSRLRTGKVYAAYLAFIGWSMVMGMAFSIFVGIVAVLIGVAAGADNKETAQIATVVMIVGSYVVIALGYSVLYQVKVKLGLWRIVADSVDLTNIAALERISASGAPASPVGEGLADALNVGSF